MVWSENAESKSLSDEKHQGQRHSDFKREQRLESPLGYSCKEVDWPLLDTERASTLAQVTQHPIRVCWLFVNWELLPRSLLLPKRVRVVLKRVLVIG